MPVIIASVIMGIPPIISYFTENETILNIINNYLSTTRPIGFVIYITLIIIFTFVYTFFTINPEELSIL